MVKRIAGVLSFLLFFSVFQSNAASAEIKPGTKCTKQSNKINSSGYTYTCIKKSGKLIWSAGVPTKNQGSSNSSAKAENSCPVVGNVIKNSGGTLECRAVSDGKLQYFQLSKTNVAITNPTSPDRLELCRLKDQRPVKDAYYWQQFRAIAYPAQPERGFKNFGEEKIVIAGIDFADAPGTGTPKAKIDEIIKNSTEWLKWYSQGNLKWNFVTYDKWVRAPQNSVELKSASIGEDAQITNEIKSQYVTSLDKVMDLSEASAVWIIYPESATKIYAESQNRSYWNPITLKNGSISPLMLAIGYETYLSKATPWLFFVHETMHGQGIMGHSPQWPWVFGIMNNEYSPSNNLSGWESLVMGWGSEKNLYCIDKQNVSEQSITLVPIEREQAGISTVLVKISDSKILGIESHRVDKWSPYQFPGLYVVSVYLIDLAIDNSSQITIPPGAYLKNSNTNHGYSPIRGTPIKGFENFGRYLLNGVGVALGSGTDLSSLMYLGESLSVEGVKISLVKSGDNDTIRIEKAA